MHRIDKYDKTRFQCIRSKNSMCITGVKVILTRVMATLVKIAAMPPLIHNVLSFLLLFSFACLRYSVNLAFSRSTRGSSMSAPVQYIDSRFARGDKEKRMRRCEAIRGKNIWVILWEIYSKKFFSTKYFFGLLNSKIIDMFLFQCDTWKFRDLIFLSLALGKKFFFLTAHCKSSFEYKM